MRAMYYYRHLYIDLFFAVNNIVAGNAESFATDPNGTNLKEGDALNMVFIRSFARSEESAILAICCWDVAVYFAPH
jgi:hypothetical protein